MTADMVIKFFTEYGWQMTVLATSGIFLVGFIKSSGIFEKLGKAKKYVYFALSSAASVVACTVYLFITNKFVWKDWAVTIACIIPYTLAIYGIYENTGLRGLFERLLFKPVKNLIGKLICLFLSRGANSDTVSALLSAFGRELVKEALSAAESLGEEASDTVQTKNEERVAQPQTNEITYNNKAIVPDNVYLTNKELIEKFADITRNNKTDTQIDASERSTSLKEGYPKSLSVSSTAPLAEKLKAVFPELKKKDTDNVV